MALSIRVSHRLLSLSHIFRHRTNFTNSHDDSYFKKLIDLKVLYYRNYLTKLISKCSKITKTSFFDRCRCQSYKKSAENFFLQIVLKSADVKQKLNKWTKLEPDSENLFTNCGNFFVLVIIKLHLMLLVLI